MTNKQQNNKIVYLSINSSYSHSSLAYEQLKAYCSIFKRDFLWVKLEYTTKDNQNEIIKTVCEQSPYVILSTGYIFNISFLKEIIPKIKLLLPETKIFLGGPEFLGDNSSFLKSMSSVSGVIRGDETSFPGLLENLESKANWLNTPGLCFLDTECIYKDNGISEYPYKSLDSLSSPYTSTYLKSKKPFIQIETSRGCYSNCIFCTSALTREVKHYSIERVAMDLAKIKQSGIKEVRVLDRTFNLPQERAIKLLELFKNKFPEIHFHIEFDPFYISDDIYSFLVKCKDKQFHIEAGVQSLDPLVLNSVNRKSNIKKIKKNLERLCRLSGIELHSDLIFGLPNQTYESFIKDLNYLILAGPKEIQVEVLKILPGTRIASENKNDIISSVSPPYDVLSTKYLSINNIVKLEKISKLIDTYYNHTDIYWIIKNSVARNNYFIEFFADFDYKSLSIPEKPSIRKRFINLLKFYRDKNDDFLYELTLFMAFKNGLFDLSCRVKLIKEKDYSVLDMEQICSVWQRESEIINKPIYFASFEYPIHNVYTDKTAEFPKNKTNYIFRYGVVNNQKSVSSICIYKSDFPD